MDSSPVIFDPRGSLHLKVGDEDQQKCFLVCPHTMARACSAWEKMLFGRWAESKQASSTNNAIWEVIFPEDNPISVELILNIIHGRYNKVPESLSVQELFNLTVLTDKYDLTSQLRPWAAAWFKAVENAHGVDYMLLWISWELGKSAQFEFLARRFSRNSSQKELCSIISSRSTPTPPRFFGEEFLPRFIYVGINICIKNKWRRFGPQ
jgi:hypothetical protein